MTWASRRPPESGNHRRRAAPGRPYTRGMARRVVAPHRVKRRAPRTGTVHGASGKPRPTNQSAAPVPAQAPLKTFPLPGGRWMAEGQTDEGASMDPTDCFSIQHPLIRPCGPPSPLWGEGQAVEEASPFLLGRRSAAPVPARHRFFAGPGFPDAPLEPLDFVGRDDPARQTTTQASPHPALRATFPPVGGRSCARPKAAPAPAKQRPKPCFLSAPALDGGEKG